MPMESLNKLMLMCFCPSDASSFMNRLRDTARGAAIFCSSTKLLLIVGLASVNALGHVHKGICKHCRCYAHA